MPRMLKCFSIGFIFTIISAFAQIKHTSEYSSSHFPYKKMGLTEKQAASHLLSRFTFGYTPEQIDEVVNMGLEKWFQQQLDGGLNDDEMNKRLAGYDALNLTNEQIVNTYLRPFEIVQHAVKANVISKDSLGVANANFDKKEYREQLKQFMDANGYKPLKDLNQQLINQKIIRAAYSNNQLQEVMTDFWFNHFNVSLTKNQCEQFVLTYERDAIRPHVLGSFKDILLATAQHPAMLQYLDNSSSVSDDNMLAERVKNSQAKKMIDLKMEQMMKDDKTLGVVKDAIRAKKHEGLNENYAREIMELHTLGVDGGYTQKDVTEVARALTGWTMVPLNKDNAYTKFLEPDKWARMEKNGFVKDGDFLFRADKHDENAKTILGETFPANGGYAEGLKVINMLALHPSTAKFICKKLAVRFVCDTPSVKLINQLAEVYLKTSGNIKSVLTAIVNSDEFWSKQSLNEKIKSPFELAISTIRATHADVLQPNQIYNWCTRMGQKFYYYQAPTGFPDKAGYWINTGSVLNRMNFGLAFATQKIPGIQFNLLQLNNNHEPESVDAALLAYNKILLPEDNNEKNLQRLIKLIRDDNVEQKINNAAQPIKYDDEKNNFALNDKKTSGVDNEMLAQVVGIIIGSPDFQRR